MKGFFGKFGTVKNVRLQKYLSRSDIYMGTRLIDVVLDDSLPRIVNINGYMCSVWYKGQSLICNLCGTAGHRSSDCPNKDKCRLCGAEGHFARSCPSPWNRSDSQVANAGNDIPDAVGNNTPAAVGTAASLGVAALPSDTGVPVDTGTVVPLNLTSTFENSAPSLPGEPLPSTSAADSADSAPK